MTVPGWWAILLLGLGVYRICRLVGWDDLTTPLRPKLVGLTDEEHSQWTYVMNALQKAGHDPWAYRAPVRAMPADTMLHPSVQFMVAVGEGIGQTTGNIEMPPLVTERIDAFTDHAHPGDQLVPFTRVEWYASKLIRCPWCLGWWVSIIAWIAWQVAPQGTLVVMSLFALAAIPGLVAKNLDE